MQAAHRLERAPARARHDLLEGVERGSCHGACGFEHAGKRRRVAIVEISASRNGTVRDRLDVPPGMEAKQLVARRAAGREQLYLSVEFLPLRLVPERALPI